jgi:hypothetical protein
MKPFKQNQEGKFICEVCLEKEVNKIFNKLADLSRHLTFHHLSKKRIF